MDDIKVSVCMTTYNHERFIAQAVDSVLAQQRNFRLELVIGEDMSTDRTREIVQELAHRHSDQIRLRLSERNEGGKANFLATIAECRGQYVAMLEGDDYWTSANKLQLQVDALDAHPEWAICFHPSACMYEDGLQGVPVYPFGWTKPVATIDDLFLANFMATSAVVFRNRLFPAFPAWFRGLVIGDWPLHILNAAHGDIGFLPEVMSAYRIHRAGVWSGAAPAERLVMIFEAFNAIDHHFDGKYTHSINKYRADTIRYVMSQLEAATQQVAGVTDQIRGFHSQAELQSRTHALTQAQESVRSDRLEIELKALQKKRQQLMSDHSALQNEYAVLAENTQRLQAFYEVWSKSLAYRVEREIRRPFRRLRRYWENRRSGGGPQTPPSGTATSKAA